MIVTCDKCGKGYQIDSEQRGEEMSTFQCDTCDHVITVSNPGNNAGNPSLFNPGNPGNPGEPEFINLAGEGTEATPSAPAPERETNPGNPGNPGEPEFINLAKEGKRATPSAPETIGEKPPAPGPRKGRGAGLRGKMFFLFFIVPICLVIFASFYYLNQMKTLSGLITDESYQVVTQLAEQTIAEKGRSVAKEVERFFEYHPELKKNPPFPKEDYNKYPEFQKVAIQKVGQTGYTCLVAKHTESEPLSKLWAHPLQKLIGVDIDAAMKKTLGEDFQRWYDITIKAFKGNQGKGQEAAGYYMWFDKREKYMVMVPVEGTDFFIASTTYLDEFTKPMTALQARANELTATTTRSIMIVLIATALLVAFFVVTYSYRLSGKLKSLADAADHISVGDLDVEIEEIKSRDELGELSHALSRMQTSIGLAIKRLRERRGEART